MTEVVHNEYGHGVWIELRLSTTRGSRVAITVGMSERARQSVVDEVVERCQQTFQSLCEEYGRGDDLIPENKGE